MKVISFLGISDYKKTTYFWNGEEKETEFFPEAVAHFVRPDEMLICLTPTAREGEKSKNWQELKQRFEESGIPCDELPIPEGRKENELWDIFEALTNAVAEGEQLIFDITNSFRSLPFLSFLAIAYLKSAKKVNVKYVLYGAYEARNEENRSPVFDLTPFVSLLDWLTVTEQFVRTGNASYLAKQLNTHNSDKISDLVDNISQIALGLELLRPLTVADAARELPEKLRSVESNLPRPFSVVAKPLEEAYAQFGIPPNAGAKEHLQAQLRMINWYFEKERFVQTLSMAREWVVSWMCFHFNLDMWNREYREEMEFLLNGGIKKNENGENEKVSPYREKWKNYQHYKDICNLWDSPYKLANLRNDVLHSGFRKNPEQASNITCKTKKIVDEINRIAMLIDIH